MIARFTLWLARNLFQRQVVESSLLYARRRDQIQASLTCICGDPRCDLPWSDGGRTS